MLSKAPVSHLDEEMIRDKDCLKEYLSPVLDKSSVMAFADWPPSNKAAMAPVHDDVRREKRIVGQMFRGSLM